MMQTSLCNIHAYIKPDWALLSAVFAGRQLHVVVSLIVSSLTTAVSVVFQLTTATIWPIKQ